MFRNKDFPFINQLQDLSRRIVFHKLFSETIFSFQLGRHLRKIVWAIFFSPAAGKSIISSLRPPENGVLFWPETKVFLRFYKVLVISGSFYAKVFPGALRAPGGVRKWLFRGKTIFPFKQSLFFHQLWLGDGEIRIVWVFWQSTILIFHQVPPAFKKRKTLFRNTLYYLQLTTYNLGTHYLATWESVNYHLAT